MNKVTTLGLTFILALTTISHTFGQNVQRVRIDFTTPKTIINTLI